MSDKPTPQGTNLPAELAAIVERAMKEFGKYYTIAHAIPPDFKPADDMMQDILICAVQEAAQWGKEERRPGGRGVNMYWSITCEIHDWSEWAPIIASSNSCKEVYRQCHKCKIIQWRRW
ncbi:MAG: hypothetical protein AB1690_02530 [Candidatus Zixiibacteriota bacterium]